MTAVGTNGWVWIADDFGHEHTLRRPRFHVMHVYKPDDTDAWCLHLEYEIVRGVVQTIHLYYKTKERANTAHNEFSFHFKVVVTFVDQTEQSLTLNPAFITRFEKTKFEVHPDFITLAVCYECNGMERTINLYYTDLNSLRSVVGDIALKY
jgi:hypothetical protein